MALKRLTTEEMVQLSGPWVTEGTAARQAILSVPEMAGVLPRVDAAHKALHAAQPGAEDPRLARLQEEATAEDLEHDTLIRGTHTLLMAARNQWIRAVNALVANGDLAEASEEVGRTVFGALRLAEKTADRRVKVPALNDAPEPEATAGAPA